MQGTAAINQKHMKLAMLQKKQEQVPLELGSMSAYLLGSMSACLPTCLPVCLPVCLPACLPVCVCNLTSLPDIYAVYIYAIYSLDRKSVS